MDMKTINTVLSVCSIVSALAGLALIIMSIFGLNEGSKDLIFGLMFVVIGSGMNIMRMQLAKRNSGK